MNIDRELMSLLEDCIYQEGFIANLKQKRVAKEAKKREDKIKYERKRIKEGIMTAQKGIINNGEYLREMAQDAITGNNYDAMAGMFEDYGWMIEDIMYVLAAKKASNMLTKEELIAINNAIAEFRRQEAKNIAVLKQGLAKTRDDVKPDFKEALEDYAKYLTISAVMRDEDGLLEEDYERIAASLKAYNQLMAEKQHPTDN